MNILASTPNQVLPLIGDKAMGDVAADDLKSVRNQWMEQRYAYTTASSLR